MAIKQSPALARPASLLQPVLGGMILFLGFAALSAMPAFSSDWVLRYMLGHPISRMSSLLFFVGVAASGMAAWNIWIQRRSIGQIGLGENGGPDEPEADSTDPRCVNERQAESELAAGLLNKIARLPRRISGHVFARRLSRILGLIQRDGAGLAVYNRLELLAEEDAELQSQRYAFPRILVWAIPLLGFLGTVLGISEAMGGLNVGGESDLQQMMGGLQSNLNVAFDTTAQALVLSIVLMFGVFATERMESLLLAEVTLRTEQEICNWFVLADEAPSMPDLKTERVTENAWSRDEMLQQLQVHSSQLAQSLATEISSVLSEHQNRQEQARQEQARQEQARQEQVRQEQARQEQARQEQARLEQDRQEQARQEQVRQEQARQEQARQEQDRQEKARREQEKMLRSQPGDSHRIESALVQLTTVLGELQREFNFSRTTELENQRAAVAREEAAGDCRPPKGMAKPSAEAIVLPRLLPESVSEQTPVVVFKRPARTAPVPTHSASKLKSA